MAMDWGQCILSECGTTAGCAHRGPRGEFCYFPSNTDKLYTKSDLEALRERCAKVADEWNAAFVRAGDQFDRDGALYRQARIAQAVAKAIRAISIEEVRP